MLYQAVGEWNCVKSPDSVMGAVLLHMPAIKQQQKRVENKINWEKQIQ